MYVCMCVYILENYMAILDEQRLSLTFSLSVLESDPEFGFEHAKLQLEGMKAPIGLTCFIWVLHFILLLQPIQAT